LFNDTVTYSPERWKQRMVESKLDQDFDDFDVEQRREFINTANQFNNKWVKKLFIIVCVRLGLEGVDEEYFGPIRKIFDIPQCVGIMGGKKDKALYFVGHEGNSLIFLDPHYVTDAIKKDDEKFSVSSYT
jgi:hypothetical protein